MSHFHGPTGKNNSFYLNSLSFAIILNDWLQLSSLVSLSEAWDILYSEIHAVTVRMIPCDLFVINLIRVLQDATPWLNNKTPQSAMEKVLSTEWRV